MNFIKYTAYIKVMLKRLDLRGLISIKRIREEELIIISSIQV